MQIKKENLEVAAGGIAAQRITSLSTLVEVLTKIPQYNILKTMFD
jgi:hypothetical protein